MRLSTTSVRRASAIALVIALGTFPTNAGASANPAPARDDASAAAKTAHRFNTWTGYPADRYPEAVTTGDFNDDGAIDVAYARNDGLGRGMTVQINKGDGTMDTAVSYASATVSTDIKAGDLDGDLDLDLAMVSTGSSLVNNVIDLYFNNGDGVFTRRTAMGGSGPQKMVLADLDDDGDLDLAMSSGLFGEVMSVIFNKGDGTFGSEKYYTVGKNPKGIAAADFDGDGDVDLAVARNDPETLETSVQIWSNNGAAKFKNVKEITLIQQGEPSLVADDFNGDGKPDLAVGMFRADHHVIMLNRGHLKFDQSDYVAGTSAEDLTSGDLDGDGDSDIVLATLGSSSTGDVSILRNEGKGTFVPLRFSSGYTPRDAAIADIDGDGKADIVVAEGSETGAIHFQRPHFAFGPPDLIETALPVSSVESSDIDHDDDLDLALSINDPFGGIGYIQIMENVGKSNFQTGQLIDAGLTSDGHAGHVQPVDLNGDGWDDLVWTISEFFAPIAPIVISMNNGDGVYGPPKIFVGTDRNGIVSAADMDGDGDLDLVAPQFGQQIAIYLNNGHGSYGAAKLIPVDEFPGKVITRDLSGDGVVDLATVHNGVYGSGTTISVLLGTGGAKFAPSVSYTVGQGPLDMVATDLDNDGDLDLVTSNNGGDDISVFADESTTVLLNKGNGKYDSIRTYAGEPISGYSSEWAIDAADFDGDGDVDVAVTNVIGNNVGIYYGNGDGTLAPQQVRYGLQNGAYDITAGDFNADGRVDLVSSGYLGSEDPFYPPAGLVVLKNRGDRTG